MHIRRHFKIFCRTFLANFLRPPKCVRAPFAILAAAAKQVPCVCVCGASKSLTRFRGNPNSAERKSNQRGDHIGLNGFPGTCPAVEKDFSIHLNPIPIHRIISPVSSGSIIVVTLMSLFHHWQLHCHPHHHQCHHHDHSHHLLSLP